MPVSKKRKQNTPKKTKRVKKSEGILKYLSRASSVQDSLEDCEENVKKAVEEGRFNEYWREAIKTYEDPLIIAFPATKPTVLVAEVNGVSKIQYIEIRWCSYSTIARNFSGETRTDMDAEYFKGLEEENMIVFCLSSNPWLNGSGRKGILRFFSKAG